MKILFMTIIGMLASGLMCTYCVCDIYIGGVNGK
jgi:hypothetical protein